MLDADPNNSNNILLVYNRASISGQWDGGSSISFNREHVWPKHWLNLTSAQVDNGYTAWPVICSSCGRPIPASQQPRR
jgi:hypothetical protein